MFSVVICQDSIAGKNFLHQNQFIEIMLCWKCLFSIRACHGYSLGCLWGNKDQYCGLSLRETLVRQLNFKKSPADPGKPRRFYGQNWDFFLILPDVGGISRGWGGGSKTAQAREIEIEVIN